MSGKIEAFPQTSLPRKESPYFAGIGKPKAL
jgi:hypothetical protein